MTVLSTYKYCYGSGSEANRRIVFERSDEGKNDVTAIVHALMGGEWREISRFPASEINIEFATTSQKIERYCAERSGQSMNVDGDKKLSEITPDQQDDILKAFNPKGPWRIEITNDISDDPRFEKVVRLNLFKFEA
jgi:hypothetical protein